MWFSDFSRLKRWVHATYCVEKQNSIGLLCYGWPSSSINAYLLNGKPSICWTVSWGTPLCFAFIFFCHFSAVLRCTYPSKTERISFSAPKLLSLPVRFHFLTFGWLVYGFGWTGSVASVEQKVIIRYSSLHACQVRALQCDYWMKLGHGIVYWTAATIHLRIVV